MVNSNKKNLRITLNSGAILRIAKSDINFITLPKTNINGRHISARIEFQEQPKTNIFIKKFKRR